MSICHFGLRFHFRLRKAFKTAKNIKILPGDKNVPHTAAFTAVPKENLLTVFKAGLIMLPGQEVP